MNRDYIEIPKWKVSQLEIDIETNEVILIGTGNTRIECYLLEFVYGPQGTLARLTPKNDPNYVIYISQSATMEPAVYIVKERPSIPDEPSAPWAEPELPVGETTTQLQESGENFLPTGGEFVGA